MLQKKCFFGGKKTVIIIIILYIIFSFPNQLSKNLHVSQLLDIRWAVLDKVIDYIGRDGKKPAKKQNVTWEHSNL